MTSNSRRQRLLSFLQQFGNRSAFGGALGAALLGVFLSASAQAAVFTVNSPSDVVDAAPGNGVCETAADNRVCTLRAAIEEANALGGTDEIILPPLPSPAAYVLTLPAVLLIDDSLTITGGEASTTIIDGNRSLRPDRGVLNIGGGITVNLIGVTIRNGGKTIGGGGISNGGTLTLTNSTVSGNIGSLGGGIFIGGTATLSNSTVSGNNSRGNGGGIRSDGTVTLSNSTVSGNTASVVGGGIRSTGTLTLTNSAVTGNSSGSGGGGITNNEGGTLTLTNSTVSGNSAGQAGGGISSSTGATLTLINSTVSRNSARSFGGGIFSDATTNLFNATITNNQADADFNGTGTGGGIFNSGILNFQKHDPRREF